MTDEDARIDQLSPARRDGLDDAQLLSLFTRPVRSRPWLRVNFVASADGAATREGVSGDLGDAADRRLFALLRRLADVVLVAAGTVRAEGYGPMLLDAESVRWRVAVGLPAQPVFAIVTRSLDLDPASSIFRDAPVRPLVVTVASSPAERRAVLSEVAEVVVCGKDDLDPRALIVALAQRGLVQLHCEGGPSLLGALLEADVVDELCLTLSPTLEAGEARRIATGPAVERPQFLAHVLLSGDTLLLRYLRSR